jgi:hypothetical protein
MRTAGGSLSPTALYEDDVGGCDVSTGRRGARDYPQG